MPMLWPGSDNHLNHPAHTILRRLPSYPHFDLIVIGGGAAGLACAVVSAQQGCKTLVVEASDYLGGTSAYSAGTLWVPNTHLAAELGAQDNFEKAAAYLDRAVGNNSSKAMRDTFLTTGAEALETLEQAGMHFRARPFHPDYLSEIEGSTSFGRALEAVPFDGRLLGPDFSLIRPPIPEFTVLGGMMVDRDDVGSLLSMTKSTKSLKHSISIVGRYFIDRLRHTRGTRLVMGNALIGQLLLAARKAGVEIAVKANVVDIEAGDDIVGSVVVEQNGVTTKIRTARGVVLATGGFAGEASRRDAVEPPAAPDFGPAAPRPAGRIYEIALRLGGHFGSDGLDPFFWAPSSVSQRTDGTKAVFPHFVF